MGHMMGAIQLSGFRDAGEVHADMADTFKIIRDSGKEPDQDRIYIHGETEAIATAENWKIGIPITPKILEQLHAVAERLRINDTL
jgi:LDH2 family malate/lactate/ureidoglycolate dehydrogenase